MCGIRVGLCAFFVVQCFIQYTQINPPPKPPMSTQYGWSTCLLIIRKWDYEHTMRQYLWVMHKCKLWKLHMNAIRYVYAGSLILYESMIVQWAVLSRKYLVLWSTIFGTCGGCIEKEMEVMFSSTCSGWSEQCGLFSPSCSAWPVKFSLFSSAFSAVC